MIYIIVSMLAGITIVLNRIVNYKLAEKIGVFQSTLFNYIVGLVLTFGLVLIFENSLLPSGSSLSTLPWWAYFGGMLGVIVVALSSFLTPKISSFYMTLFIFIAQLFAGGLIDFLIKQEISPGKMVGGLIVFLGLAYNLMVDKNEAASKS